MLDTRLVGYWSDDVLYLGSMEASGVAFRADGSGFTYWSRDGGVFTVNRFDWRTDTHVWLEVRLVRQLSGMWRVRGDRIEHRVDHQYRRELTGVTSYTISPGHDALNNQVILLALDDLVGLGGQRFAFRHGGVDDPTTSGPVPRGSL